VSATRISLMASFWILIVFLAVAQHLQWCAIFTLPSVTGHSCRNLMPQRYELFPQWQQNRSNATIWLLYKIPVIQGCTRCF
jgi:hypothetical protein